MYMPPSVQVTYETKYGDQEIGVLAESINAGIKAFMTGGGWLDSAALGLGTAAGGLTSGGLNWLKGAANKVAPGVEAIAAIGSGIIITPRMELMFEGIQRRNFSFNFDFFNFILFSPKNIIYNSFNIRYWSYLISSDSLTNWR